MSVKQNKIWKFLSSVKLAISLLAIIALLSLIGTLIPQNEDPSFYISRYGESGYRALLNTGLTDVYSSWWFILFLVLFSLNLTACILSRFSLKSRLMGTLISHISVLIILAGALVGMLFGQKGYVKIEKGEEVNSFIDREKQINLGFSLRLDDFIYSENIDPREKLLVYSGNGQEPIAGIPTEVGAESDIADTGYKVKILRYLPDFAMDMSTKEVASRSAKANNPAIEVELKGKDGAQQRFWVFARFPDIHQKITGNLSFVYQWANRQPKDFVSKVTVIKDGKEMLNQDIRVNFPLGFTGYTFFQSSYDEEHLNWTGLKVVKDPGVGVVYLGFGLLILGLSIRFYISPFIRASQK